MNTNAAEWLCSHGLKIFTDFIIGPSCLQKETAVSEQALSLLWVGSASFHAPMQTVRERILNVQS